MRHTYTQQVVEFGLANHPDGMRGEKEGVFGGRKSKAEVDRNVDSRFY